MVCAFGEKDCKSQRFKNTNEWSFFKMTQTHLDVFNQLKNKVKQTKNVSAAEIDE